MAGIDFLFLVPAGSVIALLFAGFLAFNIMRFDEGNERMKEIAHAVKVGARAYLVRQNAIVSIFFGIVFCILFLLARGGYLVMFVPFAFLTGGFLSGLAGFVGIGVSVAMFVVILLTNMPADFDVATEQTAICTLGLAHLPLMVIEGVFTALVTVFLGRVRPQLLDSA